MVVQPSYLELESDGLGPQAKRLEAHIRSDEKAAKAKAVLSTCHDLQLHLLPLDQMWGVVQNSTF
jgi:hypothetical protein